MTESAEDSAGSPAETSGMSRSVPADEDSLSISQRIANAQARISARTAPVREKAGGQAKATAGSVKKFVADHPVLTVTGAVVAGAVIALALPGKSGRKIRGSTAALGGLFVELAATYGKQMLTMAEGAALSSQEKLGEFGESLSAASGTVARAAENASETAAETLRHAGGAVVEKARDLSTRFKR